MTWRRFFTVVGLGLFAWFVIREWKNLDAAWEAIRKISLGWISFLLLLEVAYYVFNAMATKASLAVMKIKFHWRKLFYIGVESIYLNSIVPSVGLAGVSPLWEYAQETNQSKKRTATGYVLTTALEVIAIGLLWVGVTVNHPSRWIFLLVIMAIIGPMFAIRKSRPVVIALFWAAVANTCEATLLYFLFQAMHYPVSVETALTVYSAAMLTWYLSPTPQGLGTVEIAVSALLVSKGLPSGAALAIPLVYRVFVHITPATVGLLSFTYRHVQPSAKESAT